MCIIQYKFNVSVTSPLAYINTNYTLLASSSSTHVEVTESTGVTKMKPAIEEVATSGKKKTYIKTLYTMNLHLNIHLDILKRMERNFKEYSYNILRYMNIY